LKNLGKSKHLILSGRGILFRQALEILEVLKMPLKGGKVRILESPLHVATSLM
jgi:hypothetical protein